MFRRFLRWQYRFFERFFLVFGFRHGLVKLYDFGLIEKLRTVYYGGVPGSIMLLVPSICSGACYDRAVHLSMGLDKFDLVWGSVRYLRVLPRSEDRKLLQFSDHCWVESDGWVYDTTLGFMLRRWFYYLMELPIVRRRKNQDWCRAQPFYQEEFEENLDRDKYMLPLLFPLIEPFVSQSPYAEVVQRELDMFKERIDYLSVLAEIAADREARGWQ